MRKLISNISYCPFCNKPLESDYYLRNKNCRNSFCEISFYISQTYIRMSETLGTCIIIFHNYYNMVIRTQEFEVKHKLDLNKKESFILIKERFQKMLLFQ